MSYNGDFSGVRVAPFGPAGETDPSVIVHWLVIDDCLDTIVTRGNLSWLRVHFFDDDCVFCERLPDRTYGLCTGDCGAPLPKV